MRRRQFFPYVFGHAVVVVTASSTTGCGTLFHPERRYRSHGGQIDWKVAAMNGLGLMLFFVPGVIAFAVDFYTGAIYLPAGYAKSGHGTLPPNGQPVAAAAAPSTALPRDPSSQPASDSSPRLAWQRLGLTRIDVPREQLTARRIEQIVQEQAGHEVALDDAHARLSQLTRIEQFHEQWHRHRANSSFGMAVRSFFS